jgi:hypothetical protein
MITLVISDTDGNEIETLEFTSSEVLPFVNLIKEFGYLGENAEEYLFKQAQVLSEKYVYVDLELK